MKTEDCYCREGEGELVTEIDCDKIILEDGLGFCPVYGMVINYSPCIPNCQHHGRIDITALLYENRICYEEQ